MARIFISHAHNDEVFAVGFTKWLENQGWDDVFLDIDPNRGISAGVRWQDTLRKAANHCEVVVLLISNAWIDSKWCIAEFLLANSLRKRIFAVLIDKVSFSELPIEMTAEWQLCDLTAEGLTESFTFSYFGSDKILEFPKDGLTRIKSGLRNAGLRPDYFPWPPDDDQKREPYRGLHPLEEIDAPIFFGRDSEILTGLEILRGMRESGDRCFMIILAASGAGKSSFLRAGLIPRLHRDENHFLPLPVLRPGTHPLSGINGLGEVIFRARERYGLPEIPRGEIISQLSETEFTLRMLSDIRKSGSNTNSITNHTLQLPSLILPIDQAEELFENMIHKNGESNTFLKFINYVLSSQEAGSKPLLVVVATVRSTNYDVFQTCELLREIKTVVFDSLKPMPSQRFRDVITGPAKRSTKAGIALTLEPDLVDKLVDECQHGADTLPLLGLMLSRLYRNFGSRGRITLNDYHAVGKLDQIIEHEAESTLSKNARVRKQELDNLRSGLIPWLVTMDPVTQQPTRRTATKEKLPLNSMASLDKLAAKRLLTTDQRQGTEVIEIAHEALFRNWGILAEWLHEERNNLISSEMLKRAATAWNLNDQKNSWLIQGEQLEIAKSLLKQPHLAADLIDCLTFVKASRLYNCERLKDERRKKSEKARILREKLAAEELARKNAEAREKDKSRSLRITLLTALTAILFAFFATQQWIIAVDKTNEANKQTILQVSALGQAIGKEANDLLIKGKETMALNLLNSYENSSFEYSINMLEIPEVQAAIFTLGNTRSEIVTSRLAGRYVYILPEIGRIIGSALYRDGIMDIFSFSGSHIGLIGNSETKILASTVDKKYSRIAILYTDGNVELWNLHDLSIISKYHIETPENNFFFEYIPAAYGLVVGTNQSGYRVYDIESGIEVKHDTQMPVPWKPNFVVIDTEKLANAHNTSQRKVDITNRTTEIIQDKYLYDYNEYCGKAVSGDRDGSIRVYSLHDYSVIKEIPYNDRVFNIHLNPTCDLVAVSSEFGVTDVFDIEQYNKILTIDGAGEPKDFEGFSEDGSALVFSVGDRTHLFSLPFNTAQAYHIIENVILARAQPPFLLLRRKISDTMNTIAIWDERSGQIIREFITKEIDIPLAYYEYTDSILILSDDRVYEKYFEDNSEINITHFKSKKDFKFGADPGILPNKYLLTIWNGEEFDIFWRPSEKLSNWVEYESSEQITSETNLVALTGKDGKHELLYSDSNAIHRVNINDGDSEIILSSDCPVQVYFANENVAIISEYTSDENINCKGQISTYYIDQQRIKVIGSGFLLRRIANHSAFTMDSNGTVKTISLSGQELCNIDGLDLNGLWPYNPGQVGWSYNQEEALSGVEGFFSGAMGEYFDGTKIFLTKNGETLFYIDGKNFKIWDTIKCELIANTESRTDIQQVAGLLMSPDGYSFYTLNVDDNSVDLFFDYGKNYAGRIPLHATVRYYVSSNSGNDYIVESYSGTHRLIEISKRNWDEFKSSVSLEQYHRNVKTKNIRPTYFKTKQKELSEAFGLDKF